MNDERKPIMPQAGTPPRGWHVADWGPWGWLETIIKSIALLIGIAAFFAAGQGDLRLDGNPRLAAVVVVGGLTVILSGILLVRIWQRELISFAYGVLNMLGHVAVTVALLRAPDQTTLPLIFAIVYFVGQLVKDRFLRTSDYLEPGATKPLMFVLNAAATLSYIILTVALLL